MGPSGKIERLLAKFEQSEQFAKLIEKNG